MESWQINLIAIALVILSVIYLRIAWVRITKSNTLPGRKKKNMKKRSNEEIARQVDGLKKERNRLPEYSMFGDNNHAAIDAAIEVLEERKSASDYEEYDESVHSFPEDDIEHVHQMALQAENWLDGYTNDDLFD